MHPDARVIVETLALAPHPEGGYYRETHRAPLAVPTPRGPRAASTAIYYLLPADAESARHRVAWDEVWHHYAGDPLELTVEHVDGRRELLELGPDVANGQRPQAIVPAGAWQAARPLGSRYALCGCTVAPGFEFADFELG
jgi:predicted cupin superfamily sugar epimerase